MDDSVGRWLNLENQDGIIQAATVRRCRKNTDFYEGRRGGTSQVPTVTFNQMATPRTMVIQG